MDNITRIGLDTSKQFFQVHGVNAAEQVVLRRKLNRRQMEAFFAKLPPVEVGLEACGASHHWARWLEGLGHTVRMMPPQLVKAYIPRNKNDAADAEGLCEAMSRPTMGFVPVKTQAQQADLMLMTHRERLICERTRLSNGIRGHAAEFGYCVSRGLAHLEGLLANLQADTDLPELASRLFERLGRDYRRLNQEIAEVEAELAAWHKQNECSRRLDKIPGVGPVCSTLLVMKVTDVAAFKSGRDFAAWLGLTPQDHSTAGKQRLGGITRAGDETLRSKLVAGATAVIQHARRSGKGSPWLLNLLKRKPPKLVAVALANKNARIAWKLMMTGETYNDKPAQTQIACAA